MAAEPRRSRDPWQWLPPLAALALLVHSAGAPLGEPFADDFFFLRRIVIPAPRPWLDGGGSPVFWRPLGRQAYFAVFGPAMVAHPGIVVALHVVLLATSAWLLFRAFRPRLSGAAAATAAAFPLLVESGRMLIGWPSHFQDVGAIVFAALALHEASRGRLGTTLASLLAALLCKEVAAVAALLVPWLPARAPWSRRTRSTWLAATLALLAAWGAVYLAVVRRAGITFEHAVDPIALATPLPARILWAVGHGARGAFSLPALPSPLDTVAAAVLGMCLLVAVAAFALRGGTRARVRGALPLAAWGLAWFLLASASLAETYPSWSAQRCVFGAAGLGVALAALLGAVHPALLAPLVALQLALFAASPAAPRAITTDPVEAGEFDFRHFVRLERITREVRELLAARLPTLPHGARVAQHNLPLRSEHVFADSRALQTWYRDSTLRWVRFDEFARDPALPVAGLVEYQPHGSPQFAFVEPDAMRALLAASERARAADCAGALAALARADAAQRDTAARIFFATTAAKRAVCLQALGRGGEAEAAARRALALWPENPDSRYTLASLRLGERRYAEAETLLVTQLTMFPNDRGAAELLERTRTEWRASLGGR